MEIIQTLVASGVAVAFLKIVEKVIEWRLARKAAREDREAGDEQTADQRRDDKIKAIGEQLEALAAGHKVSMRDRITYLGRRYIKDGSVAFDDRDTLIEMHEAYHALGGNGHMDAIMAEVMKLQLKK